MAEDCTSAVASATFQELLHVKAQLAEVTQDRDYWRRRTRDGIGIRWVHCFGCGCRTSMGLGEPLPATCPYCCAKPFVIGPHTDEHCQAGEACQ